MRRCHALRGDSKSHTIHNAIFVDTETHEERVTGKKVKHILNFGWAAFVRRNKKGEWGEPEWHRFESKENFWTWCVSLLRVKSKTYLFCHNTNFDLPVLDIFEELPALDYNLKFACIEAPPTILKFARGTSVLMVCDTLNWWPTALKNIGETLNLPKLPMPESDNTRESWDAYCRRDVEVIMYAVERWCDFILEHDLGSFAYTTAGQAFKAYTHRFMPHKIYIHNNEKACEIERLSYKGGRNECFSVGNFPGLWYLFDVNSMYPFVMSTNKYPTSLRYVSKSKSLEDLEYLLKSNAIIARVKLRTLQRAYGIQHKGKLVFPIGEFWAELTTPELKYAIKHQHIIKVAEVCVYRQDYLFKDYINTMYNLRLKAKSKGNLLLSNHYKLLMNSLYGKFGQKGLVYEECPERNNSGYKVWREYDVDTETVKNYRTLAGLTQVLSGEIEHANSFVGIAAHVTAYARMYLWELITHAKESNVLYMDTDSVVVNRCGAKRLSDYCDDLELGKLKKEGTFAQVTLYGCKDYTMDYKDRHKGVKKSAAWVSSNRIAQEKWSSLKGLLRGGSINAPTTEGIYKQLNRIYNKGTVLPDGRVLPLVFDSDNSPET